MKCKRVRKLLTAYTDGELAEEEHRSVSAHLAECEECCEYAAEVKKVLAWAGTWRDRQPSAHFLARVKARARAAEEPVAGWFSLRLPRARTALAGVGAACLVFLFGYLAGVSFSGAGDRPGPGPSVANIPPPTQKGTPVEIATDLKDSEQLVVGVQRIKMIFRNKLSDAAYAQLNEVQFALAKGDTVVVEELQQAEEFLRERKFAQARRALERIEEDYAGHPLVPYARMTKIFTTPEPGFGRELLNRSYAMLLQDTVINPREFYDQITGLPAQATEYGWQKIVESAERLNPVGLLDYLENRLVSENDRL